MARSAFLSLASLLPDGSEKALQWCEIPDLETVVPFPPPPAPQPSEYPPWLVEQPSVRASETVDLVNTRTRTDAATSSYSFALDYAYYMSGEATPTIIPDSLCVSLRSDTLSPDLRALAAPQGVYKMYPQIADLSDAIVQTIPFVFCAGISTSVAEILWLHGAGPLPVATTALDSLRRVLLAATYAISCTRGAEALTTCVNVINAMVQQVISDWYTNEWQQPWPTEHREREVLIRCTRFTFSYLHGLCIAVLALQQVQVSEEDADMLLTPCLLVRETIMPRHWKAALSSYGRGISAAYTEAISGAGSADAPGPELASTDDELPLGDAIRLVATNATAPYPDELGKLFSALTKDGPEVLASGSSILTASMLRQLEDRANHCKERAFLFTPQDVVRLSKPPSSHSK